MSAAEKWSSYITNQEQYGLTQAEYCRQNNLHPVSFSQWKRRLKDDTSDNGFVALELPVVYDQIPMNNTFRIILGNGIELIFPMNAGSTQAATFVNTLRRA